MKLTPTTFYIACKDGLYLMHGHEFDVAGRKWVVHKRRPPEDEFLPGYVVSEKDVGMTLPGIPEIRHRGRAAEWAREEIEKYGAEKIGAAMRKAKEIRDSLKVIESPPA